MAHAHGNGRGGGFLASRSASASARLTSVRLGTSALASAIRAAYRGGLVLAPEVARDALEEMQVRSAIEESADAYEMLTDREKEITETGQVLLAIPVVFYFGSR